MRREPYLSTEQSLPQPSLKDYRTALLQIAAAVVVMLLIDVPLASSPHSLLAVR